MGLRIRNSRHRRLADVPGLPRKAAGADWSPVYGAELSAVSRGLIIESMRLTTPVAVVVISMVFSGCTLQKPSTGIYVALLNRRPNPAPWMTDGDGLRTMTIEPKRVVRVQTESVRFEDLGVHLQKVFGTRSERLLLVRVTGPVEFGDVIAVLDRASSRVALRYCLLTEGSMPTPTEPSLFLGDQLLYTQYFFPLEPLPL